MKANVVIVFVTFIISFNLCLSNPGQTETDGPLFSMSSLDSGILKIVNCGIEPYVQIALTVSGSIIKSKNNGFFWESLDSDFISKGKAKVDFHPNEIGDIRDIIQSAYNPSTLFFVGTKGINWLTSDCAKTLRAFNHGRRLEDLLFHPINENWILTTAYTSEEDEVNSVYKELYLSIDGGLSWRFLIDFVIQVSWGLGSSENFKFGVPRERILVARHQDTNKAEDIEKAKESVDFVYSDDFFISKKISLANIESFTLTNERLFVKKKEFLSSNDLKPDNSGVLKEYQNVWHADTKHLSYEFSPIYINVETNTDYGNFKFMGKDELVMTVASEDSKSKFGDLYINDIRGGVFTSSLDNVMINNNHPEITEINGIEGILFANVFEQKSQIARERKDITNETQKLINTALDDALKADNEFFQVVTKLSFNQGISWHKILPPQTNSLGGQYKDCVSRRCYLHLHYLSAANNDFLTKQTAIGVIVANGNVGERLDITKTSLFLSRDGGLSWRELRKRSHIFNVGNNGSIIVIAPKEQLVTDISYSIDEGVTFNSITISSIPIRVDKIINIKNSLNFLIHGSDLTIHNQHESGAIIGINFTKAFQRECLNPEYAGSDSSDYELWSPHADTMSNKKVVGFDCLLGQKITYTRRKEKHSCYNGSQFNPKIKTEKCKCQETDYVCDFGYDRDNYLMPCVKIYDPNEETLRLVHGLTDQDGCKNIVTKGYRKIVGNKCIGGVDLEPQILECEQKAGKRTLIKILIFVALFLLLAYAVYKSQSASKNDLYSNTRESKRSEEMFNISQQTEMNRSAYEEYIRLEGKSKSQKKPNNSNRSKNTSLNDTDSD